MIQTVIPSWSASSLSGRSEAGQGWCIQRAQAFSLHLCISDAHSHLVHAALDARWQYEYVNVTLLNE